MYLRSKLYLLYQTSESRCDRSFDEEIMLRSDNIVQNERNLQISKIYYVTVAITRFAPLGESGFRASTIFRFKTSHYKTKMRKEKGEFYTGT